MHINICSSLALVLLVNATPIPLIASDDSSSQRHDLHKRMKFIPKVFSSSGDNVASSLRGAKALANQVDTAGSSAATQSHPTVQDWSAALSSARNRQQRGLLSTPLEAHTSPSEMFILQKNKILFERREGEFAALQKRLADFQQGELLNKRSITY